MCAAVALIALVGCAVGPSPRPSPAARPSLPHSPPTLAEAVIAQNERFVLYRPKRDDTLSSLARHFLGDERRSWEIADFNGLKELTPGNLIAIPLRPVNPVGVFPDGYQTVPILAYHRFGEKDGKMVVTAEAFAAQLKYLTDNDYRVIRLADLVEFLAGKRSLPPARSSSQPMTATPRSIAMHTRCSSSTGSLPRSSCTPTSSGPTMR